MTPESYKTKKPAIINIMAGACYFYSFLCSIMGVMVFNYVLLKLIKITGLTSSIFWLCINYNVK